MPNASAATSTSPNATIHQTLRSRPRLDVSPASMAMLRWRPCASESSFRRLLAASVGLLQRKMTHLPASSIGLEFEQGGRLRPLNKCTYTMTGTNRDLAAP